MNDPWDVKSVRQPGQYVSCMKINGVPLLPPLLSKECREEMKYYKLLAMEIQKRISALQPYVCGVESSSSDYEESTDTLELPECAAEIRTDSPASQNTYPSPRVSPRHGNNTFSNINTNVTSKNIESPKDNSPKFYIDLNVNINNKDTSITSDVKKCTQVCSSPNKDVPERDYNCYSRVSQNITEKQTVTKVGTTINVKKRVNNDYYAHKKNSMLHSFSESPVHQDGPSSISSKSFTGSLNDLYSESIRDSHIKSGKLVRQSSYTLLQPSPELLAHLEIHAQTTGVDMASISMSESLSNLSTPNKKRRSWDLESAKMKWSTMALELKQKGAVSKSTIKSTTKKITPPRPKSVAPSLMKRNNAIAKPLPKSEPLTKSVNSHTAGKSNTTERAVKSDPPSPTANKNIPTPPKLMPVPIEPLEDPATRVRELYEKVQKQQLMQMASLVEKQKKEQLMLQQVFEEQNHMLFKQLKTICPKSPVEAKQAWVDQNSEADRGPVSLSQVFNYKSSENSPYTSPVSSTLTDTNYYINHCDNVLKKSRDITDSLKKQPIKFYTQNGIKAQSRQTELDGSKTRTHSPVPRNNSTSRRLNYDTSASTDRDYEPILTDRTNDTMADLNVTFPSDHSEEDVSIIQNKSVVSQYCNKEVKTQGYSTPTDAMLHSRSTDIAINKIERVISNSISNSMVRSSRAPIFANPPTATERAAATKIVAHVKGYLVRRLMRTERVQGIVQTIKDALLCALQLHQDREGIRGADVDLHRRLIQQITAACYSLHDTFVSSNTAERCAMIAADRDKKKRALNTRQLSNSFKQTNV